MKSMGDNLLRVVGGVFEDTLLAYPMSTGLLRDFSRLVDCVKSRGLRVFTLDLPSLDEFLLASLEARRIVESQSFLTKAMRKDDVRPRFMHDLWSLLFTSCGGLNEDVDPNAILFLRQIFCLGKKLAIECAPDRTEKVRLEYHSIESQARPPSLPWDEDDLGGDVRRSFASDYVMHEDLQPDLFEGTESDTTLFRELDTVCQILVGDLGLFLDPIIDKFNHGPGAVADGNSKSYKYDFPHWPVKLGQQFDYQLCGSSRIDDTYLPSPSEPPSRLIAVPKTAKGPRLIAAEPIAHQWCQQWVKNEIVARLPRVQLGKFVDILNQRRSQELVLLASSKSHLATLDLSSASDRLLCWHVERMCQSNESLLRLLHSVRTRWVHDKVNGADEYLRLKKFAAMGSALTFPIQSIFFACVAIAACGGHSRKSIERLVGHVRVYGDDIIVPVSGYEQTLSLLKRLGLVVNVQKSFCYGKFRESCGVDAYEGYNVTPIKPKVMSADCAEDYVSLCDTSNNLHKAGFWRAARYVAKLARYESYTPIVVPRSSGLLGLASETCDFPMTSSRWNSALHRSEIRVQRLTSRSLAHSPSTASGLLDFFTQARNQTHPREESTMAWNDFQSYVGRRDRPSVVLRRVWEGTSFAL